MGKESANHVGELIGASKVFFATWYFIIVEAKAGSRASSGFQGWHGCLCIRNNKTNTNHLNLDIMLPVSVMNLVKMSLKHFYDIEPMVVDSMVITCKLQAALLSERYVQLFESAGRVLRHAFPALQQGSHTMLS
jgi:hypothetical protein